MAKLPSHSKSVEGTVIEWQQQQEERSFPTVWHIYGHEK